MKKHVHFFLMLTFLITVHITVLAQIGMKGGLGISDIAFSVEGQSPYLGYEVNSLVHKVPAVSYQIGIYGLINISNRWLFQPELLYARYGLNYDTEFLYDDVTFRIKIDYLQLPLLLKYKTMPAKSWHVGFFAGPYASLKLNANKYTVIEGQEDRKEMPNIENYDVGIIGGLSFDFDVNRGQIVTGLRCSYSLMNIMSYVEGNIPEYNGPENGKARNVAITILVGYQFTELLQNK